MCLEKFTASHDPPVKHPSQGFPATVASVSAMIPRIPTAQSASRCAYIHLYACCSRSRTVSADESHSDASAYLCRQQAVLLGFQRCTYTPGPSRIDVPWLRRRQLHQAPTTRGAPRPPHVLHKSTLQPLQSIQAPIATFPYGSPLLHPCASPSFVCTHHGLRNPHMSTPCPPPCASWTSPPIPN